jgi:glycosyltransferase involved in cell wall biosynthesis
MATYNGEKYIKEQLDSILSHLKENDEVIVSDDSSSDKTVEIIKAYNDSRIKIIENQKFQSPISNFEMF